MLTRDLMRHQRVITEEMKRMVILAEFENVIKTHHKTIEFEEDSIKQPLWKQKLENDSKLKATQNR